MIREIKGAAKPTSNNSHMELLGDWIQLHKGRTTTLLDVGCGGGQFSKAAQDAGFVVYGIDADERMIETTGMKIGGMWVNRQLIGDDIPVGWHQAFDYVTSFQVIEHMEDPKKAIHWIWSLLQPGGCFVGSVPNNKKGRIAVGELLDQLPQTDDDLIAVNKHKNAFDMASVRALLQDEGFKSIETYERKQGTKERIVFRGRRA